MSSGLTCPAKESGLHPYGKLGANSGFYVEEHHDQICTLGTWTIWRSSSEE